MGQDGLIRRVEALERHHGCSRPVFVLHRPADPHGRCPDCDLDTVDHFTISIDQADGSLERRYMRIDWETV